MFSNLNISSIINLFFTLSMVLLVYFYLKKRLDCVENKVDIMFNLIQEHQKQIKMQEVMNKNVCADGFCNVSDFTLPMSNGNEDEDENENENCEDSDSCCNSKHSGSESDEESDDEDDSDDEILNDDLTETNNNQNVESCLETNVKEEEEENIQENVQEDNIDEENVVDENIVEPTEQNVSNWTQNTEGDNITVLEDNNNNKIKISIVKNVDSDVDYSKLKVQELKKIANERNIVGYSSLKKKELIKLLE